MTAEEYNVINDFLNSVEPNQGLNALIDQYNTIISSSSINVSDYQLITGLNSTTFTEDKTPQFNFNLIKINKFYAINKGMEETNIRNNISVLLDYDSIGINSSIIFKDLPTDYFYRFNDTKHHIREFKDIYNKYKVIEEKGEQGVITKYIIYSEGILDFLQISKELINSEIDENNKEKFNIYKDIIDALKSTNTKKGIIPHSNKSDFDEIFVY